MSDTIFDKIVHGEIPARIVWEGEKHIAFLTPFPNTPGTTVVIPKTNLGDNVFMLNDTDYSALLTATKRVAELLRLSLKVPRVALVFEGTGIAYVHAKLYPLHGELAGHTDVWGQETEFVEHYRGYITTKEGPQMDEEALDKIHRIIRAYAQK